MEILNLALLGERLFTFVLESLQNVTRHMIIKLADMSMVVYSKANGGYTKTTGNVIPQQI